MAKSAATRIITMHSERCDDGAELSEPIFPHIALLAPDPKYCCRRMLVSGRVGSVARDTKCALIASASLIIASGRPHIWANAMP
jgi:hypothetical protein